MKKLSCIFFLVISVLFQTYAADGFDSIIPTVSLSIESASLFGSDDFTATSALINEGLEKNLDGIAALSINLSPLEKSILYEAYRMNPALSLTVNATVGMGIGSYIQGDVTGGTIALVGELCSISVAGAGYFLMSENPGSEVLRPVGIGILAAGAISFAVFRVFECLRPYAYASDYNNLLVDALNGRGSLSIAPVVGQDQDAGMTVMATIGL